MSLDQGNTIQSKKRWEGLGITSFTWATGMPTAAAGQLRVKLTLDLTNKTVNVAWWGLGSDSGVSGTQFVGNYAPAFLPTLVTISRSAAGSVLPQGYDNLFLATGGTVPPFIPEPSTCIWCSRRSTANRFFATRRCGLK